MKVFDVDNEIVANAIDGVGSNDGDEMIQEDWGNRMIYENPNISSKNYYSEIFEILYNNNNIECYCRAWCIMTVTAETVYTVWENKCACWYIESLKLSISSALRFWDCCQSKRCHLDS